MHDGSRYAVSPLPRMHAPSTTGAVDGTGTQSEPESRFGTVTWWHNTRLTDVAIAATMVVLLIRAVTSVWMPFGYDHGIMAATGHSYLTGGMPYRDAWDMKGPIAFAGFALSELVFGRNMWGVRILDAVIVVSSAFWLGKHVAAQLTVRYGAAAAAAFMVSMAANGWFYTAQPEGWVAATAIFAIARLLARNDMTLSRMAVSGVLIALCGLVKPLYFLFGIIPILHTRRSDASMKLRLRNSGIVAISMAVPVLIVLAAFKTQGALDELIEVHLRYTTQSYAGVDYGLTTLAKALWESSYAMIKYEGTGGILPLLFLAPATALGLAQWRGSNPMAALVLTAWFAIAVMCVVLQGKFYPYHWQPVYPPAIVLACFGWSRLTGNRSRAVTALATTLVIISAALVSITPAREVWLTVRHLVGVSPRADYLGSFVHGSSSRDVVDAASFLQANSVAGDKVYVWGHEATVTYLSGLTTASRFVFALPLADPGPFRARYRSELIDALTRALPRYFVIGEPFVESGDKAQFLREFPELQAIVDAHYRLTRRFGNLDILERNGPERR